MNLVFDGFEHLTAAYLNTKYPLGSGAFGSISSSPVRPGGSTQAITTPGAGSNTLIRALGVNVGHAFAGTGYLCTGQPGTGGLCNFILYDGATAQVGWKHNSDGSVSVYRGAATSDTLIGTTATGLVPIATSAAADFKMIELEVVFATGATGSVVLRIADAVVLTVPTIQTSNTANAYCNRYGFHGAGGSSQNWRYDDLYINDDSGSAPHNTFYGEAFVVEKVIPNGNGDSSQFLGSDGNSTDNYLLVDDSGNNDTDYVASGTVGHEDTYACSDLTNATGTIIGVEQNIIARKDDVATREIAGVLRPASTSYPQTTRTMSGSYVLFFERVDVNPETALAWSIADINSNKIGERVIT